MTAGCTSSAEESARLAAQAQSYLDQKRIAEARIAIRKAVLVEDSVPEYHILRGRIEFSAESNENAYDAYQQALALDASNPEALQAVSQIGLQIGRLRESLDATEKLLVLNSNQQDALLVGGIHALLKRNYDEADQYADRLLSINPESEGGVVLKARVSFLAGRPDQARQVLDNYSLSHPDTEAIALTQLEIYRQLRNAPRMKQLFVQLRKLQPDDLGLRVDEANFLYKNAEKDEATRIVVDTLANQKISLEMITSSINLLREYDITRLSGDMVAKITRNGKPAARIAAARYFADSGEERTASQLIKGMSGPRADAERANIALLNGDIAAARSLLKSLLSKDKTLCPALETQAQLFLASGKAKSALQSAQRAVSECPNDIDGWKHNAEAYARLDDPINARRVYRQGIDANKQSEPIARAYAEWLVANGNDREAVATAKRLTDLAPALNSGWKLYAQICTATEAKCVEKAKAGLADSKTRFGVDLLPGQLAPNGLFGQFVIR